MVMKYVGCLVLVVLYLEHQTTCDTRHCRHGRIAPIQPYFVEKDDLMLECWSNGWRNRSSGNLSFVSKHGKKEKVFDDKFIVSQNSTYAMLKIQSIGRKMVRRYGYEKFVACVDSEDTSLCMDNVYVKLEYYPRKVKDVECILMNLITLNCTWSHKVLYKYKKEIKITSEFQFLIFSHQEMHQRNWIAFPNSSETSCFWNEVELASVGSFVKMGIQIRVMNTRQNISATVKKIFNKDDLVKPAPVRNLTYISTMDPTCIWLSWQQERSGDNFRHYIILQSDCQPDRTIQTECSEMNCTKNVCGMNPYTDYDVIVKSRYFPKGVEKGFWSDTVNLQFTSEKTAVHKSPMVTDGLYVYRQKTVILFWKPLDKCERHSNDTVYVLSRDRFIENLSMETFQAELSIEDLHQTSDSFVIDISAKNQFGISNMSSILEINRQINVPKDSELIIKYKREVDGTAPEYIATIIPDDTNLASYKNLTHTVTWCEKDDNERCKDYMRWLKVERNILTVKLPVKNPNKSYKFGLITKGTNKSTSKMVTTDINYIQCIYGHELAPYKPLPIVRLPDVIPPYSLTVEWEGYECRGRDLSVPFIENYVLTYCIAEEPNGNSSCKCSSEEEMISVSRKVKRYRVPDLTPGTGYCVWVAANNTSGLGPKNDNNLYHVVTKLEQMSDDNTLVIVMTVMVVVAAIFLLLCYKYRCIERIKLRYKDLRKVELPRVTGLKIEEPPASMGVINDPATHIDVIGKGSGVYSKIEETNLDNTNKDKDSAIYDNILEPLLNSSHSVQCETESDIESVKSQFSDLCLNEAEGKSVDSEQGSDNEVIVNKMIEQELNEGFTVNNYQSGVDLAETFSDQLDGSNDIINKGQVVFQVTLDSESTEVRSETKQENHSMQAAFSNNYQGNKSQLDNDHTNPNSSEILSSTTSGIPSELMNLNKYNIDFDLDVESNSDEESVIIDCNEGSLDGYAHIPLVSSDDEAEDSDTNIHQGDENAAVHQHDNDHIHLKTPHQECRNNENNGNHDSIIDLSTGVIYDFDKDLKSETAHNLCKCTIDSVSSTNSCNKSKNTKSCSCSESIQEDKDSDFGDVDLPANNITDVMNNSDSNKRLSVTSKYSVESVKSIESDSAIDSMDSCRLETLDGLKNQSNEGTGKFKSSDTSCNTLISTKSEKDLTNDKCDNLTIDMDGTNRIDGERDKKTLEKNAKNVVIHDKHRTIPEDYSLAEYV